MVTKVVDILFPDDAKTGSLTISPSTALVLCDPLAKVHFRKASRFFLGPLHSWWWHQSLRQRWTTIKPIDLKPMLVFMGKGLKADHPCIVLLDREIPKDSRVFALKIAEADVKSDGVVTVSSDSGLLLVPCTERGQERGTFVRVGLFEIGPSRMHRDWLDHKAFLKSRKVLREDIWSDSEIDERFYQEKDENDRYSVKIV